MVEKYKTLLKRIEEKLGQVSLLTVAKMDGSFRWTVYIAADWFTDENHTKDFSDIIDLMREIFTQEESGNINAVCLLMMDDVVTKIFLKYKSGTKLENETEKDYQIDIAYIIKS